MSVLSITGDCSLPPIPWFRIWTFGIFRIEHFDPTTGTYKNLPLSSLGGKYGRILLTSLLHSDARRVRRCDVLDRILTFTQNEAEIPHEMEAGDGHKENEQDAIRLASSRLKGAIRSLTALFTPSTREGVASSYFLLEEEIECYQLAGQEKVWVDADACLALLTQAHQAFRSAHDPFPFIKQAADYFAGGSFLENEDGWWLAARRATLEERQHECFRWLVDLYQQQHRWWEAEQWLLRLLEQDPTDAGVLSRLIDLLLKQSKYEEAFVYVRALRVRFKEEDIEISESFKTVIAQVRRLHKETLMRQSSAMQQEEQVVEGEYASHRFLTLSSFLTPPEQGILEGGRSHEPIIFVEESESGLHLPLVPTTGSSELASDDCATWFSERLAHVIACVTQWQRCVNSSDFEKLLNREIRVFDENKNMFHPDEYFLSRRSALLVIAALPQGWLGLIRQQQKTPFIEGEFLPACAASLTACWYLLTGREFASVERTVSKYLPFLHTWTQRSSSYQKRAAYLAAQGYLLLSLIASHRLRPQQRVTYCEQAVTCATVSGDHVIRIKAQSMLGNALYDQEAYGRMLQAYLEAKDGIGKNEEVPHLLQCKVLMGLAHAYAQHGQVQEALNTISEARNVFPDEGEDVPAFLSADDGMFSLVLFEGWVRLDLGKRDYRVEHAQFAAQALAKIEQFPSTVLVPERIRIEITNRRAQAAIDLGELEAFRDYTLQGAESLRHTQSEKRRQEMVRNFKAARQKWPKDTRVLELADVLL